MHIHLSARPRLFTSAIALGVLVLQPVPAAATTQGGGVFHQRNLVSDIPGLARVTDANLVNPWGLAHGPSGPLRVADNGTGASRQYKSNGQEGPTVGTIPAP